MGTIFQLGSIFCLRYALQQLEDSVYMVWEVCFIFCSFLMSNLYALYVFNVLFYVDTCLIFNIKDHDGNKCSHIVMFSFIPWIV